MKRYIFSSYIVLLVVMLSMLLVGCGEKQTTSQSPTSTKPVNSQSNQKSTIASKTYTNTEYGFSCEYPADWALEENMSGLIAVFAGPISSDDSFMLNIIIAAQELPSSPVTSLDDYAKITELQMSKAYDDYQQLEGYHTTISSIDAMKVTYTFKGTNNIVKGTEVFLFKDNYLYAITYSATLDSYEEAIESYNLVLNSFNFE